MLIEEADQRISIVHPLMMAWSHQQKSSSLQQCSRIRRTHVCRFNKGIRTFCFIVFCYLFSYVWNYDSDNTARLKNSCYFLQKFCDSFSIKVLNHV